MKWMVSTGEGQRGPFNDVDVREEVAAGRVKFLSAETGKDWIPVASSPFRDYLPMAMRGRARFEELDSKAAQRVIADGVFWGVLKSAFFVLLCGVLLGLLRALL